MLHLRVAEEHRILDPGDTIALGVPIFTPYLGSRTSRTTTTTSSRSTRSRKSGLYPDEELAKLLDPKVKAFFVVNPGNPYAVALSRETIKKIGAILGRQPHLILLTDDFYRAFVPGFRSLIEGLPGTPSA